MIAKGGFVRYAHKNNPMERGKAMVLERAKRISVTGDDVSSTNGGLALGGRRRKGRLE